MNDANDDLDLDGLTNLQEYQYSLTHTNETALDPRNPFSRPGVGDYEVFTGGKQSTAFYYDKNSRLTGADYNRSSNGLAIAYIYDGNGNILRQKMLARDANRNSLPDLWEFQNGLTNNTSAYADSDGDGWSDYQEWKAGSNPTNALSIPGTNFIQSIQTAPLVVILPTPNQGSGPAIVRATLWDGEGNNARPFLQYSNAATLGWSNATLTQVDGTNLAALPRGVSAPPDGAVHELTWNTTADLGALGTNVVLRARAQDQASTNLFSAWSAAMPYTILPNPDTDGDGLPDAWEMAAFGNLDQNGSGDFDHDGFSNLNEYLAGTNPNDANSSLKLRIERLPGAVKLSWQGGSNAEQVLQRSFAVPFGWQNIFTNPPSVTATITNALSGTNAFYQLRLGP